MMRKRRSACSCTKEEEKKHKAHFPPNSTESNDMIVRRHCRDVSEGIPSISTDPTKTSRSNGDVLVESLQLNPPKMRPSSGQESGEGEGAKERKELDLGVVEDCGREKLQGHRRDVAGRVWIPDIWGQEELLKDWIDCAAFDSSLVPSGIMSAREALVEECRRANIWWATG